MYSLIYIFVLILGLSIGSFLNCIIYRIEKKQSFLKGRSYCPHCSHVLSWKDLIPVFSYLSLMGKCRYCSKKISIQYLLMEISTGLIFLLTAVNTLQIISFLSILLFIYYSIVISFLLIIFVYDLKFFIIPDKVLFPAMIVVFLYQLFSSFIFLNFSPLWAGLLSCSFFLAIFLISRGNWMGFGDVKLSFFMGLFLGVSNVMVALFLAFFIGAIIGVGLIFSGDKKLKSEIPFGPFLITGTIVALFYGQQIVSWYTHLLI